MAVSSYDAKKVKISFAGFSITGFADGTFLNVEHNEQIYTTVVGADGDATRARTNNNSGLITITLQQSSASNAILSGLFTLDAATLGSGGTGPLLIRDASGNTVIGAEVAWVQKLPAVEFGREVSNRVWVFETDNLTMFPGSNNQLGSAALEAASPINLGAV